MHVPIRRVPRSIALLGALALCACEPELGECDPATGFELVYTADGTPAFAGQAMVNQSCGGGAFCHADDIDPLERYGAPAGLSFNLNLASTTSELNELGIERLYNDQLDVFRHRRAILEQVQRGLMPPSGADSEAVLGGATTYDRVGADGLTLTPMPTIDTDEGQEILRSWLACDAPVVERTVEIDDTLPYPEQFLTIDPVTGAEQPVGSTAPACARRCVDPTWPDIVEQIFQPTCALSRCHDSDEPAAQLDLTANSAAELTSLHAALTAPTAVAQGTLCAASMVSDVPMFVAGDADGSLIIQKITDPPTCGSLMPIGAALNEQRRCALREWVACGACADPNDAACMACVETARTTCGVVIDGMGTPQCAEQQPCSSTLGGS